MNYFKKYFKYILLFVISLFILIFFGYNNADNIWNYGMAHAIRLGELPYRDFNIISTPLYPFIMSIGLFFYDSYLVYIIEQSILILILFYYSEKMIAKGYSYLMLSLISFPVFYTFFPNYDFLIMLLIIILLYLEDNNKNELLVGIVIGLTVLSKHTVGGIILIISLINKRSLKRLIGISIPLIIFFLYLVLTNTLFNFIDLSLLGLFDFGHNNNGYNLFALLFAIGIIIYSIYLIKKKNRDGLYLLGSVSLIIPICDFFHLNHLLCIFYIVLLKNIHINRKYKHLSILCFATIIILNIFVNLEAYRNIKFSDVKHFNLYITSKLEKYIVDVADDYKKRDNNYMFSFSSMYFDIATDHKITYFDIPLYGNFGYNGINKMKKKISNMHDVYFYVAKSDNKQFAKDIYKYIKIKSKYKYKLHDFEVYYKE